MRSSYLLKRAGLTVVALYLVATLLFLLFRLAPGDASTAVLDPSMTQEMQDLLRARYGLDEPLYVQYYYFILNLIQGELGISFFRNEPVTDLLITAGLNTVVLMIPSVVFAFVIGTSIGVMLAWFRDTRSDTGGIAAVLLLYAAPAFWSGMVAIMLFSYQLDLLPSGGMHPPDYRYETLTEKYFAPEFFRHWILPVTVQTLFFMAIPTLIMRNSLVDVLGADFIEINRAQGLSDFSIRYKHAARNALLPVLHYAAIAIGFAFGGSVVIETVFSWPGVGRLMWQAVLNHDLPLAQGAFIALAAMIMTMNFFADIISVYIDPRAASDVKEIKR